MIATHDFGKDAYGRLTAVLSGAPGTQVELCAGEVSGPGGRVVREPGGFRVFRRCVVTLEAGRSEYELELPPHPWPKKGSVILPPEREMIPFRYAEASGDFDRCEFVRHEVFPPEFHDEDSFFESDNENLNEIWAFCKYTMKATAAFGIFVDGDRERLPYEGDAYVNQLGYFACCADPSIPRRTIDHFETCPTWPLEWRLLTPVIVRDYWMYTGDRVSVERWLPWLDSRLMEELARPDGLLHGDDRVRDIVDWPACERDHYEMGEANFVPNAMYILALEAMHDLTGEKRHALRAQEVRNVLKRKMCRSGVFTDSIGSAHTSIHTAYAAHLCGLAESPDLLRSIVKQRGMACSVFGARFLLQALFRAGLAQEALELLTSRGLRSWNNMLAKGATMTMEAWDDTLKPNQDWNHAWGAAPADIIPHELCGLRPSAPGFACFECRPAPLPINWKLRHPVPGGRIEAEYFNGKVTVVKKQNDICS